MGSPVIYYFPDAAGTMETLTLPDLATHVEADVVNVAASRSLSDIQYVRQFSNFRRITIGATIGAVGSSLMVREIMALKSHLDHGGVIGFAGDSDKAWAGYARWAPQRGDTVLKVHELGLYNTSATLASGDEVWVESSSPERRSELLEVSSFTSTDITVSVAAKYTYREQPILVRARDFYPALSRADGDHGSSFLLTETRIGYTLALSLDEVPEGVRALVHAQSISTTGASGPGITFDRALKDRRYQDARAASTGFSRPRGGN